MASGRALALILVLSAASSAFGDAAEAVELTEPPARFSGWHAAGIWGGASLGASFGALPYYLAATLSRTRSAATGASFNCRGAVCGIAAFTGMGIGMIAGGVLGYFLGGVARDGSLAAKIFIIASDVLGLPTTGFSFLGALVATGNLPVGGG